MVGEQSKENYAIISFVSSTSYPRAPSTYLQFTHPDGHKTDKYIFLPEHHTDIETRTGIHSLVDLEGQQIRVDGLEMNGPWYHLHRGVKREGLEVVKSKINSINVGKYPDPPFLYLHLELPDGDIKNYHLAYGWDVQFLLNKTAIREESELEGKIIEVLMKEGEVLGIGVDSNFN